VEGSAARLNRARAGSVRSADARVAAAACRVRHGHRLARAPDGL
jgi:hypothetical protein